MVFSISAGSDRGLQLTSGMADFLRKRSEIRTFSRIYKVVQRFLKQ